MNASEIEPNTFIPVSEQIARVRSCIDDEQLRGLYDAAIADLDIAANERLIQSYGATEGLANGLKFIDCAYWIFQKLQFARLLGLDTAPPKRILDIGTGGGHFCHVCRLLGHQVVGIDIHVPMYQDICVLLNVEPIVFAIEFGVPLPDFWGRFDMITAFAAQFDTFASGQLWGKDEWRSFIEELLRRNLRAPGRIFFTLNSIYDPQTGTTRFKEYVAEVFEEFGGRSEPGNTSVDLEVTDALISSPSARRRNIPTCEPDASASDRRESERRFLIFDQLGVPISAFRHPSATARFWDDMRMGAASVSLLGTFPTPGQQPVSQLNAISFEADRVVFPHEGEFYFYCDFGIFKVLVVDPHRGKFSDHLIKIFRFVARNIVHSRMDTWLFLRDGEGEKFYFDRLAEKFFFSDQPLSLYCGNATNFLAAVLRSRGIESRLVAIKDGELGHIVLEAWEPEQESWVMLDADFGVGVADASGRLLSAGEIAARISGSGSADSPAELGLQVVDSARKCWCKSAFDLPRGFAGSFSWGPQHQTDVNAGDPSEYIRRWRKCLGRLCYESFRFDDAQDAVGWADWQGPVDEAP